MINITCVSERTVLFCESKSKDFSPVKLMTNHLWNERHFIFIEGGAPDRGRPFDQSITLNHSMYRQLVTYWLIDYRSRHVVEWVTSCSRCLRGSTHFTERGYLQHGEPRTQRSLNLTTTGRPRQTSQVGCVHYCHGRFVCCRLLSSTAMSQSWVPLTDLGGTLPLLLRTKIF